LISGDEQAELNFFCWVFSSIYLLKLRKVGNKKKLMPLAIITLGSPEEKFFTPTDERGFFPYTPHPTPSFKSGALAKLGRFFRCDRF
jgi:hypothetical protein